MSEPVIDCRSEEGEAIGLVDALITVMRQVSKVDFALPGVQEALKDLFDDPATHRVMGSLHDSIRRNEFAAGRNRLNYRANAQFGRDGRLWNGGPFRFRVDPDVPDIAITMSRIAKES